MKIAVLDDYQDVVRSLDCFTLLAGHDVKVFTGPPRDATTLAAELADFDALVLIRERTSFTRELLAALPRLRLISQTGKVSGHIDVAAATELGIPIVEGSGDSTAPAELAWALILAASRKIPQYVANLKEGHWQSASRIPQHNRLGRVLKGQTLGIWGYGKIGKLVAGYGKAFGMNVLIWGREGPSRDAAGKDGCRIAASKDEFFADADIVTLHVRLTDATRGMVTEDDLLRMKPTALFVNISRATLVAPGALDAALAAGRPGQAALDVFETEPLSHDAPVLRAENVLATPHLGYVEQRSYEMYFDIAFRNVVDFANGTPKNVLNPAALGRRG